MPRLAHLLSTAVLAALGSTILAATAHAQEIGSVPRVEPSTSAPRNEVLEWTTPEGQEYWYRLPKESRRKPCLVLMLHGTGLNHGWSFWNYPIGSGVFRGDDIVVSPDGLSPGQGDTFNFLQGKADGDQIAHLIETFRSEFEISNVYLYGHSQGAFFCYWFAGEHPELVDGIVAHAGNVLDVKHPKLAKEKVAIGILHCESDQVVPVECARRTEQIYREEGYRKLRCWIVEGIRPEAGHWPLPDHVAKMMEWLDSVSVKDARQAVEIARSSLARTDSDFPTAVRAAAEARDLIKKYDGEDREQVERVLEMVELCLQEQTDAIWKEVEFALLEHEEGDTAGTYTADVRWARAQFAGSERFEELSKPFASLFKKHDKAFEKLERIKDKDTKAYAKNLLDTIDEAWFALAWADVRSDAAKRVEAGWRPVDGMPERLAAAAERCGTGPSESILETSRKASRREANVPSVAGAVAQLAVPALLVLVAARCARTSSDAEHAEA
ncbi:MAG: alpha/beta hydrolase [Planctomycetota bacterium]